MCRLIRGNVDGGGSGPFSGSIKVSFSFIDPTCDVSSGGSKKTGVRCAHVFAIATGVKESYEVVKVLLGLFDFKIMEAMFPQAKLCWQQDTKMNWLMSGKSHGGTFPCICVRVDK